MRIRSAKSAKRIAINAHFLLKRSVQDILTGLFEALAGRRTFLRDRASPTSRIRAVI
jgi:hypothetical protein